MIAENKPRDDLDAVTTRIAQSMMQDLPTFLTAGSFEYFSAPYINANDFRLSPGDYPASDLEDAILPMAKGCSINSLFFEQGNTNLCFPVY